MQKIAIFLGLFTALSILGFLFQHKQRIEALHNKTVVTINLEFIFWKSTLAFSLNLP